jgi:NAD(P)-dependent dehydrogenase (short-subunit alcohol dehydrogenase family)
MTQQAEFPSGAAFVFGASGGIGRHVAKALAQAGTAIALGCRSKPEFAEQTADEARALGVAASVHVADVTDAAAVKAALEKAREIHGRIHSVVWAAGPLVPQFYIAETPPEAFARALAVEAGGFFAAAQAAIPLMRADGGGSFVHLGSAGDVWWPAKDGLSVAPKAVNEALVRGIAKEEGKHNIRANSVLVGVIEAGMFLELTKAGVFDAAWVEETQKLLALKRWGQPEEIGHAVVYLASRRAAYVTGQQINVSGGFGI